MKINLDLGLTRQIIAEANKRYMLRNQLAYTLATGYWETDAKMLPIIEAGGEKYRKAKKYYPYYGRGLVQLTWSYNYKKAAIKLGLDPDYFIKNPDALLDTKYAIPIMIQGMFEGWFTGKKLSDFLTLHESDFIHARTIINGKDKADEIASIARDYDSALLHIGYGVGSSEVPASVPLAIPAPKVDTAPSKLAKVVSLLRRK